MSNCKITIEEIARRANVSIATVSRIINNKDKVKSETKQRVLVAMEELKFCPQKTTTLCDAKSKVILMCIPGFDNPFNSPVIDGVQKSAHAQGYDVLILQSRDFYTDINDYSNILKHNSIAGILIVASVPHATTLDELIYRCPVVMCSEFVEHYGVSHVSIDNKAAAKKATQYLICTGRKKIGLLNTNTDFQYAKHREEGYLEALKESNMELNTSWITHLSTINYSQAFSNALHMLSLKNRPDAIFACSDVFAMGAINAAKQLGLKVPEDVSVIGFDNIELSTMSRPTITTIEQPCFQLGYQSCELLIEKIKNPQCEDKQILLGTELIVRESTTLTTC